jgi:fructose-1,6-bisphosphatase/inositol monophosphatase family enzyme
MNARKVFLSSALVLGLVASGVSIAQNVDPNRHPNLYAAQVLIDQAIGKITVAQKANEYDMGGHAAKAKELLAQANREIKLAALAANRNGH